MKDSDFDYDTADRHFYDFSGLYRFLRWLLAIAITVGVLIWFNS